MFLMQANICERYTLDMIKMNQGEDMKIKHCMKDSSIKKT